MLRRLSSALAEPDLATASLVLTEMVANAIRHGCAGSAGSIEVRITRSAGYLRFEVSQPRPLYDADAVALRRPGVDRGWGVLIIDRLCRDWGLLPGSRTVWAELELEGDEG